jgi:hypothetical protein
VRRDDADPTDNKQPAVVGRVFGLPGHVVHVGTPDRDIYETFVTATLGAVTGIAKIDSHLTIEGRQVPGASAAAVAAVSW